MGKTITHFPKTARYRCESCRKDIPHLKNSWMRKNGKWFVENFKANKHRSFGGLGRLYSSLSTWEQIVNEWLKAKEDPELIKVFYNTVLGEVYVEDVTNQIDTDEIAGYVEDYLTEKNPDLPNEILFLTISADTHPDRLEVSVEGWGIGEENFLVHYEQIWGDTDKDDVYQKFDELLELKWKRKDGIELMIGGFRDNRRYYAAVFDSGGYLKNTQSVYDYTRHKQMYGVIAIKGRAGNDLPILLNQSLVGKYKDVVLQNLGVDAIKEIIWHRIKYKPGGPRTIHYTTAFCDYRYFEGLFAEPPIQLINKSTYQAKTIWRKKRGARNEPWDLKVYNYAALKLASPNFEELKKYYDDLVTLSHAVPTLSESASQTNQPASRVTRNIKPYSGFVNGWNK